MRYWLYTAVFAAAMVSACMAQSTPPAAPLPRVEAFATLPALSDPALSPDGKYLALIQVYQGRPIATIRQVDTLAAPPVAIPFTDGFIVHVRWANDHRLLITLNLNARVLGDNVNPWFRTVAVDPDGKNPVVLFKNLQAQRDINYSASTIADIAPDDPDHIYMPLWSVYGSIVDQSVRNSMYKVDVNTGSASPYLKGGAHVARWIMDGTGHVVARVDQTTNPLTDHILAYDEASDDWREIAHTDAANASGFDVLGLSVDGKALVLAATEKDTGIAGLVRMSLADGKTSFLYAHPLYDIAGVLADDWSGRIIGASVTAHLEQNIYFDPKFQEIQKKLNATFPGMSAHMLSWDRSLSRIVLSTEGPMSPPAFYLYTSATNRMEKIGRTYAQLQFSDLGETRVYNYKARDGLEIPAYLTVPPHKEAKNLPVVIMPHGGPMARDSMNFDWERQFLADRGYAVLQPNFRGSSGYGQKFLEAGYGQWGLKMQDDITDGVKKLIADGIADPKRICIVGGSYGGYAALAGAAFTPDLFACAAAWAPVADLRGFLSTRSRDFGSDSAMISSWEHFIGDRWSDSEKLDAASPSENAAKIKIPVLLVHGEADATVRIDQSEEMERVLRRAGKKVTFIRIPKETHYMQTMDTRVRWLSEVEKFLKENIGN